MVNEVPTFRADQMPYGGVKDSGNTREGPAYAVREMTEERLVVIQLPSFRGGFAGNVGAVIGLVLALIVVAIVVSLLGLIWVGIPVAVLAIVLFVVFVAGFGRRAATPARP